MQDIVFPIGHPPYIFSHGGLHHFNMKTLWPDISATIHQAALKSIGYLYEKLKDGEDELPSVDQLESFDSSIIYL